MRKGFTLIEIVMIIVILGILAAVAIPKFYSLQTEAKRAAEAGVVGGVRGGIATYYADQCVNSGDCAYPASLTTDAGTGTCDLVTGGCFDVVLTQGGITTDEWERTGLQTYEGPNGVTYTYTPGSAPNWDGSFK